MHVHGTLDFSVKKTAISCSFTASGQGTTPNGWKDSPGCKATKQAALWMPTSWDAYHGRVYARTTCRLAREMVEMSYPARSATSFRIMGADGRKVVRELILKEQLKKKACVERLELSRRYWAATDTEWMVVIVDR